MHKKGEIEFKVIAGIITIILMSGATILWGMSKEETILQRNGELIATHRWHIESERTFIREDPYDQVDVFLWLLKTDGYGHWVVWRNCIHLLKNN